MPQQPSPSILLDEPWVDLPLATTVSLLPHDLTNVAAAVRADLDRRAHKYDMSFGGVPTAFTSVAITHGSARLVTLRFFFCYSKSVQLASLTPC